MLIRNEQEEMNADYYGYSEYIKLDMIGSSKYNFHIALGETADGAGADVNKSSCKSFKLEKDMFQLTSISVELIRARVRQEIRDPD